MKTREKAKEANGTSFSYLLAANRMQVKALTFAAVHERVEIAKNNNKIYKNQS